MPRKQRAFEEQPRRTFGDLAQQLAEELRGGRDSGQPLIDEQVFPAGVIRVTVFWDKWDRLSHEDRTTVILRAYEMAEGSDYRNKITLASGLTIPEAHACGMLPYQILMGLRPGDPVTTEQCRQAMFEEGASLLLAPDNPQLRFATEEEAEAGRQRLIRRLPGSEQVWIINKEAGRVEDWAESDMV
jgi:hypothetical protein